MTLLMVSPMAVSMILLMSHMYHDVQYMKAMIPHHSSAILTSKEANIKDPEAKELSKQIIESQEAEIEQMK